jgi:hypothetical protein
MRVAAQCQHGQSVPYLVNFPELKDKLLETVRNLVDSRVVNARQMVQNIVNLELAYINTSHPDFIGGSRALTHLSQLKKHRLDLAKRAAAEQNENLTPEQHQQNLLQQDQTRFMEGVQVWKQQQQQQQHDLNTPAHSLHNNPSSHEHAYSQFGHITSEQVDFFTNSPPSEREIIEIEVIKLLIDSYFRIVKKTIKDTVPKAIMFMLVNKTKDDIQSELVRELYREDKFEDLLKEGDDVAERRNACLELLRVMKKALEIINSIKDLVL